MKRLLVSTVIAFGLCLGFESRASAEPFTITAVLTGDFRPENPDNLLINVTIIGDTLSNGTTWTLDINSPSHPDANLGGFFFNLANPLGTTVSFSNFSPSAWSVSTTTQNAQGSGGALFEFRALDPPGSGNNVTNTTNLTFNATLSSGFWTQAMFLNAPLSDGGGIPDPGSQLGAHLRSLSTAGCTTCTTDSGFASGNYSPPTSVPEPSTLMLLGAGLVGTAAARRRRRQ